MDTKKHSWNHRKSFHQIVGPRLCGSDDKRRGAFCAPSKRNALGSKLCPGFFPDLDSGTRQVSVKLQAGHWGMYEKWRCDSTIFFWRSKIYTVNIIINRKIRSEVQVTVQWFLMWGFFSPKSQANRLSPLVFLQDDDIWGSPDTAEARAVKGVGTA